MDVFLMHCGMYRARLPPPKPLPLGCQRPRVENRKAIAMDAIFFALRTGYQWNALNETGLCSRSSAHRRFQEWTAVGVFLALLRVSHGRLHRTPGLPRPSSDTRRRPPV